MLSRSRENNIEEQKLKDMIMSFAKEHKVSIKRSHYKSGNICYQMTYKDDTLDYTIKGRDRCLASNELYIMMILTEMFSKLEKKEESYAIQTR